MDCPDIPRKLQRSLSSNLLSEMSREELKRMAEHAKNREEDLLLAAKLGMELQREVEDKTEKLREMENLVTQLQEQKSKKNSEIKSYVAKEETEEEEEEDKEEGSDSEASDDFNQFFRNHLIANLHNVEEPTPSPLSSPFTSPALVSKTLKPRKKLTEQQIKSLSSHQLFVEYKRYIRETLRRSQEKLEGKEEELSKIKDQLSSLSSKTEDSNHKKLIIQRLQNELEQTQLRAAQREIELKAEMRRLVAVSATSNHSPHQPSAILGGERERKRLNFSEVSSDSEHESDADKEVKGQGGESRKKTRDQLHLTLNLPQIYAHSKTPEEEDPAVLSPSLTRHIYRIPSSGPEVPSASSSFVSLVKNVKPKAQTLSEGTNYLSHKSLLTEDSETELRPLIKGGGVKDSGSGCWNQFQGWDIHTCYEIASSHFLSDFGLWVYRLVVLFIIWGVVVFHFVWEITQGVKWWEWFIYLTDWNQLLVGTYFLLAVIYSPSSAIESNRYLPLSSSFGRRVTFVLFEVAFATTLTVCIMFWSVIYPTEHLGDVDLAIDILVHGVIALWISLELLLNRIPFLWSHLIWEVVFILGYLLFNYLYTINVSPVYSMVTYKTVASTEVVAGAVILSLGTFALGYALAALRDFCLGRGKAVSISFTGTPYTHPRHSGDWARAEGQPLVSDQKDGERGSEDPRRKEFYEEF